MADIALRQIAAEEGADIVYRAAGSDQRARGASRHVDVLEELPRTVHDVRNRRAGIRREIPISARRQRRAIRIVRHHVAGAETAIVGIGKALACPPRPPSKS